MIETVDAERCGSMPANLEQEERIKYLAIYQRLGKVHTREFYYRGSLSEKTLN